ncbi:MAG: thiamine phosphate synthase [Beggiatoa sp.]|nr:thiamine phosphate synthase [Beggiatoa sp.]
MPYPFPGRGLYAIADAVCDERAVSEAIAGGAVVVQYRAKSKPSDERRRQALVLRRVCHRLAVPFIVNDNPELARTVGADGMHLGRSDTPYTVARQVLGPAAIIGVSCYGDLDRAREAAAAGADYVAFGSFYPSASKPDAVRAEPGLLGRARQRLSIPVVAIGGITPENGSRLIGAGADLLAVIRGVFGSCDHWEADPRAAARRYAGLFEANHPIDALHVAL